MKIRLEPMAPGEIEARSMATIRSELGDRVLDPENAPVILRAIHTTADFDYADNLFFSPGAVALACRALKAGCSIVTDTEMAKAGINKTILQRFGGTVHCFMADPSVAAEAKGRGVTRATVSMERAAQLKEPLIFAIGNAPTALIRIHEMFTSGELEPALVIGMPVGFVNVLESKALILADPMPRIVARGRKGGSNVAAAVCNALLYRAAKEDGQ